ncbi:MAG: guanylate kinase [Verrucomicrobia bacterium]|nr:guanylate kinase [Verrucomicrobiota bacterium]
MITIPRHPQVFIVSAPSGAGKTTLCDKLYAEFPDFFYTITSTTRAPREGEVDGKNYYFLTHELFQKKLAEGEFLEHAIVHGNLYGSPKTPVIRALKEGRDVLMNLDVQGAAAVREYARRAAPDDPMHHEVVDIFVVPPSLEVLRNRLVRRGKDTEETIAKRLKQAENEIARWKEYKYMVVNDDLAEAYDNLRAIILAERHRIRPEGRGSS